jgi:hypothetical protein
MELPIGLLEVLLVHPSPLSHLVYQTDKLIYTRINQVAGLAQILIVWNPGIYRSFGWEGQVKDKPSLGRVFFDNCIKGGELNRCLKRVGLKRT